MKNTSLLILTFLAISFQYSYSQIESQLSFELNTVLNKRSKAGDPGFAVLAAQNGKVIYKKAFGVSDMESKTPLDVDMIFNASELTKQFTAIAIMQLVEQGKISLKDPISKFIPDYPMQGSSITIEHLLTETSGIKDYSKINAINDLLKQKDFTQIELIRAIGNEKMNFVPGTAWEKSNSNYIILGFIISKISGVPYEQYIKEKILKPAGMQNSFIGVGYEAINNVAKGYFKGTNGYEIYSSPLSAAENAASGLYLTLDDYLKFYEALNDGKLISNSGLEQTRTAYKLIDGSEIPYGYGTEVTKFEGKRVYNQSGYDKGFYTSQFYLPFQDILIVVLANCELDNTKYLATNIFLKVITDLNTSLAFKDGNGIRVEYYHFLFNDIVIPKAGIIPAGEKTSVFINGVLPSVHYTTDGTEPNINSPLYNNKIELTRACTLKIKNISASNAGDKESTSYIFKEGNALEPIENISGLKPGLKYSYYNGDFNVLPDFDKLVPKSIGITELPDLNMALNPDTFAIQFNGYVYIEKDGLYNFYTISDDGSQLYLNDKLIVDSDGAHGNIPSAFVLPLKKGYYALKILYFEKSGHELLQTGFWTEGNEPKPFAKEILFYR
jgi:CubicO group peptidase (beta-lactamase class C family)